jgi:hypothetical protein
MRWKLLIAFGVCITVVLAVVAIWIVRFTTDTANRVLAAKNNDQNDSEEIR